MNINLHFCFLIFTFIQTLFMKQSLPSSMFILIAVSIIAINANAQSSPAVIKNKPEWSNCWQKEGTFTLVSEMVADKQGNSYTTGSYYDTAGTERFYVRKLNKKGNEEWTKYYPQSYSDTSETGNVIRVDRNGNIIVMGKRINKVVQMCTTGVNRSSSFLLAYDASGNLLWQNVFKYTSSIIIPVDMIIDVDNNCYVMNNYQTCAGYDNSLHSAITKIDFSGNTVWEYDPFFTTTDLVSGFWGGAITFDNHNRIAAVFQEQPIHLSNPSLSYNSIYAVKIRMNDKKEFWNRSYENIVGFDYGDFPYSVVCNKSGDVFIFGARTYDYPRLIKYSSNGTYQWTRTDSLNGFSLANKNLLTIDNNGNPITAVSYAVNKYDTSGNLIWQNKTLDTTKLFTPASVRTDAENNVYVTGNIYDGNISSYTTIRYNKNGQLFWVSQYQNNGQSSVATLMSLDYSGDVYVSGKGGYQVCTEKIANSPTALQAPTNNITSSAVAVKRNFIAYPNPAKDYIQVTSASVSSIIIADVSGHTVLLQQINGNTRIDISKLKAGMYYVKNITTGEVVKFVKE